MCKISYQTDKYFCRYGNLKFQPSERSRNF